MRVPVIILLLVAASPAAADRSPPPQARQVERHRHGGSGAWRGGWHRGPRMRPMVAPEVRVIRPRPVEFRPAAYGYGMDPVGFARLVEAVRDQPFGDDRLLVIQIAARDRLFTVDQVIVLLDAMTFGSEKLDALRMLAPLIVDPENRFEIVGAFTFSSERREAAALLG